MITINRPMLLRASAAVLLVQLAACGWVDSTGVQGTTVSVGLRNAQPVPVTEEVPLTASLVGEGAELSNWSWILEEADVRSRCSGINGFDESIALTSLDNACSTGSDCSTAIEESSADTATQFTIRLPALRAPVALGYRLRATRTDGAQVERQQLLCGLSINEAPLANDDSYQALPGIPLVVSASQSNNLLANDSDDDDVRNLALRVVDIVQGPSHAANFSFDTDGGFVYEAAADLVTDDSGYTLDRFVYRITDGLHTVRATAVVRIAADGNQEPVQTADLPELTAEASRFGATYLQFDLSPYFMDPDNDALVFSASPGNLPDTTQMIMSAGGVLNIRAQPAIPGDYRIGINISDGLVSIHNTLYLTIIDPFNQAPNHSPTVTDIRNRVVKKGFRYDVSDYFTDPDGDELIYSARGLPEDVEISQSGVISGEATDDNQGQWLVRVTADDQRGGTVSDSFRLVIK